MKPHMKIAVIGGTGKSGRYLVKALLQQEYAIKMLVRKTSRLEPYMDAAQCITGDVTNYENVYQTLSGCDAVISTLGLGLPPSAPNIFNAGAQNILRAMEALGIHRYIVTTGLNVDTPFDKKGPKTQTATNWMHDNFPVSTADKQKEYETLAASKAEWTMVRLPIITLTNDQGEINTSLEDCLGNAINAASLAAFLVAQLDDGTFIHQAPFIANK
ncbi:NAD(P)-dependent oxidoreductase [Flavobacterium sp. RHBU_24]|uniref:NAD(P)-dependent oxidoreductase n=1 Tax=Flavobacterium sp. RHBU_24 TaxID=3391185 RepID=UPI003984D616